ncbi:MAG: tetrahydromethanopterin S-methyltransferase subunit F [Methanosarcinaceae archaeon]|nr:tetrahydromethanopterin S-methyltransferase subunit F [Methanosarcinaceae archaeon]
METEYENVKRTGDSINYRARLLSRAVRIETGVKKTRLTGILIGIFISLLFFVILPILIRLFEILFLM